MIRRALGIAVLAAALLSCASAPPPDGAVTEPAATLTYPYPVPRGVKFPDYQDVAEQNAGVYVRLRIVSEDRGDSDAPREGTPGSNVLSFASGIIIDPRGYAVTAAHIALSTKFKADVITMDGRRYHGAVIAVERQRELALIKFNPFPGMAVARFADSSVLAKGDPVVTIGTPAHRPGVVTVGRVMNPRLEQRMAYNDFGYDNAIEVAMRVDAGNSGGPLLDHEGELVGMIASMALGASGSKAPPRPLIGLAVPSNDIRAFLAANAGE